MNTTIGKHENRIMSAVLEGGVVTWMQAFLPQPYEFNALTQHAYMEYGKRPITCWLAVFGERENVILRTGDVQERLY